VPRPFGRFPGAAVHRGQAGQQGDAFLAIASSNNLESRRLAEIPSEGLPAALFGANAARTPVFYDTRIPHPWVVSHAPSPAPVHAGPS